MDWLLLCGMLPALVTLISWYELYLKSTGRNLSATMKWVLWLAYPLLLVEMAIVFFMIFKD
jgi:hypothetical protein